MVELSLESIAIIMSVVIGIAAFVAGQLWSIRNRKDTLEKAKNDKLMSEQILAKELRAERLIEEKQRKDEMKEYIKNIVRGVTQDFALKLEKINSRIDLNTNIIHETRKELDIMQSLAFGIDAKSIPPFMLGLEATEKHDNAPGEGMFYEPTQDEQDEQTTENNERLRRE